MGCGDAELALGPGMMMIVVAGPDGGAVGTVVGIGAGLKAGTTCRVMHYTRSAMSATLAVWHDVGFQSRDCTVRCLGRWE